MEGIITKSMGSSYLVFFENQYVECLLKGKFRIEGLKATNPIAVGDVVEFDFESNKNSGIIKKILPRRNYIIRKSTNLSKIVHIIASNIDRAYIIVTLVSPRTSTGFIDRFLVTAEAYHIPTTIVFNKIDTYSGKIYNKLIEYKNIYQAIGYETIEVSAKTGENMQFFAEKLKNKINLFSGHSGVGKSAIINKLIPKLNLKTSPVSDSYQKGKHTTTFAEMIPLLDGGFIIDTPGIKEFGLIDFNRCDLTHYFPEMFKKLDNCKYYNCTHINEPDCAVKKAVEEGEISESRYNNYVNIFYGRDLLDKDWD